MKNAAAREEVLEATHKLTDADLLQLERYAVGKASGLGNDVSGEDLLNEAIRKTMSGDRRWNKDRGGYKKCLRGVIRSIASNTRQKITASSNPDDPNASRHPRVKSACDLPERDTTYETFPSKTPDPETKMAVKEQIDEIEQLFADDPRAFLVLDKLSLGMNGPEIRTQLGLSQPQYETIIKRIRRKTRKHFGSERSSSDG